MAPTNEAETGRMPCLRDNARTDEAVMGVTMELVVIIALVILADWLIERMGWV